MCMYGCVQGGGRGMVVSVLINLFLNDDVAGNYSQCVPLTPSISGMDRAYTLHHSCLKIITLYLILESGDFQANITDYIPCKK